MKSDLTRVTFNPAKHYRAVQQQQGRVQLDADWNEQIDITGHRIETETVDTVGECGAPMHHDGFRLVAAAADLTAIEAARPENKNPSAVPAGDLLLTAGHYYVDGVLAENDKITLVSAQPDLPTPAEIAALGVAQRFPPNTPGTYLAVIDVFPRLRTAIDEREIREVALGGPDTATRIKDAWQVRFLAATAGDDCVSPNAAWDALVNPKLGTLAASVAPSSSKPGPCIVDPGSSYRRLENQLYRVEVHLGGDTLAKTTFKWSRDNGSIVTKWTKKNPLSDELEVESTGRDKVLNIATGHWVELTDDAREELGVPGTFALVTNVSGNIITIDSAGATGPVELASFPRNPKVRRWDSAPAKPGKWLAPDGEKTLNSVALFELEDGVVVQFGVGAYHTGDYWLIPARTALPFVEWPRVAGVPVRQLPHGVAHHFCKLAIVELTGAGVFNISDCRHRFPPLTELTSLFYLSGDGQEATPDPTKPAATLLPLPLPLKVGVANGEWPVTGARVRFTVAVGGGTLIPATGIGVTGADGVASCNWSIDSATPDQAVIAELLDDADIRVHLPVTFHARLNTASLVAYNPATCEGMRRAAVPIVTVQDALDFLCREKSGVECCVTIGRVGKSPGDYETVAEAIEDLIFKRRLTAVCLTLLPGDHVVVKDLIVASPDRNPVFFKIAGCSHGSRLVVSARLVFSRLAAAVIRDVSILVDGGQVDFDACNKVEISRCMINGRASKAALLNLGQIDHLTLAGNQVSAVGIGDAVAPAGLLAAAPLLASAFLQFDDADFEVEAAVAAEELAKETPRNRALLAEELRSVVDTTGVALGAAERKRFADMLRTLGAERVTARTLLNRFKAIRAATAAVAATAGNALALLDFDAVAILTDNQFDGIVSIGGTAAAKPLAIGELERLQPLIAKKDVQVAASRGTLHVRGNTLFQVTGGEDALASIREAIAKGSGTVVFWSSAHFTDNIIEQGGNYFCARHLALSTTRFSQVKADAGAAVSRSVTYVANSADNDVRLFSVSAVGPALAANLALNIVPL